MLTMTSGGCEILRRAQCSTFTGIAPPADPPTAPQKESKVVAIPEKVVSDTTLTTCEKRYTQAHTAAHTAYCMATRSLTMWSVSQELSRCMKGLMRLHKACATRRKHALNGSSICLFQTQGEQRCFASCTLPPLFDPSKQHGAAMRLRAETLSSGQRRTRAASAHNVVKTPDCFRAESTCDHRRGPQASCRSHRHHAKPDPTSPHLKKQWCSLVAVAGCRERMQAELESADDGRPRQPRGSHTHWSLTRLGKRSPQPKMGWRLRAPHSG